jgi:hypothetical protein
MHIYQVHFRNSDDEDHFFLHKTKKGAQQSILNIALYQLDNDAVFEDFEEEARLYIQKNGDVDYVLSNWVDLTNEEQLIVLEKLPLLE